MISIRLARVTLAALFVATLCGCFPAGSSQPDEEKEPYFLRGRERVNAMDYGGAIEAFTKALELNPHSGAAHFELGWLYADKQPDPAAAIYHYERYLKLRPRAENGATIRQHIFRLKQDLAKAVLPLPSTPGVQRQLEQLMEENRRLKDEVEKLRPYYANRAVAPPANATGTAGGNVRSPVVPVTPANPPAAPTRVVPATRTHRVQAGETPSSIARKYSIQLAALMAANPGLQPTRMQVGQVLNIPAP